MYCKVISKLSIGVMHIRTRQCNFYISPPSMSNSSRYFSAKDNSARRERKEINFRAIPIVKPKKEINGQLSHQIKNKAK